MKKNILWIASAIIAIAVFAGVYILYGNLIREYSPDNLAQIQTSDGLKDVQTDNDEDKNRQVPQSSEKEPQETVKTVPDFTVFNEDGKAVRLSDYFGKPIVLNFWATWCYYCKEEMPDFNRAYKEYPDIQFLMINATDGTRETQKAASEYIQSCGFEFSVLYDKEQAAVLTYGISGLPATFFIDEKGRLVTYANGKIDYDTLVKAIGMIKSK